MKRSGFTMIELIFVIVILGILAAIAIPKLAATRDDAKISALATSTNTAINEIVAGVTATGVIASDLRTMSNALAAMDAVDDADVTPGGANPMGVAQFVVKAVGNNGETKAACITVATTGDGNLTVTHTAANTGIVCTGLKNIVANNQNMALKGTKIRF